jgi:hypothetical protein
LQCEAFGQNRQIGGRTAHQRGKTVEPQAISPHTVGQESIIAFDDIGRTVYIIYGGLAVELPPGNGASRRMNLICNGEEKQGREQFSWAFHK